MLFLLNDCVLMISGGKELLERTGFPMNFVAHASASDAVVAMQSAIYENPNLWNENADKAAALCWLLNAKTQANSAMFLPIAPKIKSPNQVAYKLGKTDLTTLGALLSLQKQGRLTNQIINDSVWKKVA